MANEQTVSEIKHIVLEGGDAPARVAAGEYHADPLIVEAGAERHVSIALEAGASFYFQVHCLFGLSLFLI